MHHFHLSGILFVVLSLLACAEKSEAEGNALSQFKWKNRIILCYPKNDDAWAEQEKTLEKQRAKIEDRDLVIFRVDKSINGNGKGSGFETMLTEAQRLAVIKKYDLTPGTSLLIGKDGGAKQKQSGKLRLEPLFELIDQMPMRREEMKSGR